MGHEPVLVPDTTLFIQLAIFLASYFVLRSLLFRPYIELLHERREKTLGMKEKAQSDQASAEKHKAEYEDFMRVERKRIAEFTEAERRKIGDEEKKIIDAARAAAAKQQQAVSATLAAEYEKTRAELKGRVPEYASLLASKILGKKVQVGAAPSRAGRTNEESVIG